ncbi:MAG: hypothetical protein D3M94_22195 [Rhodocyclales bacterium GT-UBC]|nr:MAG: hypothetical protein D3M94_22195 [Rhodocyclales bacterium GT-UBC]
MRLCDPADLHGIHERVPQQALPAQQGPGRYSSVGALTMRRLGALLRSDTAALMLANLAAALLGIITGVIAARALGPTARGELAVVIFWPALIATIVEFGVPDALTLRVSRDPSNAGAYASSAYILAGGAAAVGAVGGGLLLPLVLRDDQAHLLPLTRAAMSYIPLSSLSGVPLGLLLGLQRFRLVATVRVATALLYTVGLIAAVALGRTSVQDLTLVTVAARGLPLVLALPFARTPWRSPLHHSHIGPQARMGASLHGARLAAVIGASEDRLLASVFMIAHSIGLWQVASAIAVVMQFISQAFGQKLYASSASSDASAAADSLLKAYLRSVVFTAICAAAAWPALPLLVSLLYGPEFSAAASAGRIVLAGTVLAAGAVALQAGARAALRTWVCVGSELLGGLGMAAAAYVFNRPLEPSALALAYLLGRAAVLVILVGAARIHTGLPARAFVPSPQRIMWALRRGSGE